MQTLHNGAAMPSVYPSTAQVLGITRLRSRQLRGALTELTRLATQTQSETQHEALTSRIERIKNLLEGEKLF